MPDYTRIINLSQLNDPDFEKAFIFFSRHLVSLSGSCQPLIQGMPTGEEQHFTYSGFILSIRGVWNFVTAGHILKDHDNLLAEKRVKHTRCFLLDDFGPDTISNVPIPFDYENAPRLYIDEAGLDFGLVALSPHYQRLLQANGIVPVDEEQWIHQHKVKFDRYFMVGLPSLFLSTDSTDDTLIQNMAVTIIPAAPVEDESLALPQTKYPRLVAKLPDNYPLDEIDGMSGGPILGFSDSVKNRYWVVAVQSRRLRSKRLIFACPIPVLATLVEHLLDTIGDNAPANDAP
jgi:hypothetical protein